LFSLAAEHPNRDYSGDMVYLYPSQVTSPSAPTAHDGCVRGQGEEGMGLA